MPVEVIWDDDEKTIVRQIYSGVVTLEDYHSAIDDVATLVSSVDYIVHSIMDRTAITRTEGSFMKAMKYSDGKMPKNMGLRVIIKASRMTEVIANMGRYLAPDLINNIEFVDTLEEARNTIAKHNA